MKIKQPVGRTIAVYSATPLARAPHLSVHLGCELVFFDHISRRGFYLVVSPYFISRDTDEFTEPDIITSVVHLIEPHRFGATYNRHRHQKLVDDHRQNRTAVEALVRRWCDHEGVTLLAREPQPWDDDFVRDADDDDGANAAGGKEGAA